MASSDCHDERAAVWSCACSPARSYCNVCLLRHVESLNTHHTVSRREASTQSLCGMCKELTHDAVSCKHPVCLCGNCLKQVTGAREVLPRGEANVMVADVPAVNMEAIEPARLALEERKSDNSGFFNQQRNSIQQQLALTMSNFEDIMARALTLDEELAEAKEKLRLQQEQIATILAKDKKASDSVQGEVEKIQLSADRLENERLKAEIQTLMRKIKTMECQHQLREKVEFLTAENIDLKRKLHELPVPEVDKLAQPQVPLQRLFQEFTETIAKKISDVIPVLSQLNIDWMTRETAEGFIQLSYLGTSSELQPSYMRIAGRISLVMAKFLGPCDEMTEFTKGINKLLQEHSEQGVNLLKNLETLYMKMKDEPTFKELAKNLVGLVGKPEGDNTLKITAKFSPILSLDLLISFAKTVLELLKKQGDHISEWTETLIKFPLEWSDQALARTVISNLVKNVIESKFSNEHLALLSLLQSYRPAKGKPVLLFAERAGLLLLANPLKGEIHQCISSTLALVEEARNSGDSDFCECAFNALKLIRESPKAEEICNLTALMHEMMGQSKNSTSARILTRIFENFESEDNLRDFSSGVMQWMFSKLQQKLDFSLLDLLLQKLNGSRNFLALAIASSNLLSQLSSCSASQFIENCFLEMENCGINLDKTMNFSLLLTTKFAKSAVGGETHEFVGMWKELLVASNQKDELTDTMIALLEFDLYEAAFNSVKVFHMIAAAEQSVFLAETILTTLKTSVSERASLTVLLQDIVQALSTPNLSHDLAIKCLRVWVTTRSKRPGSLYGFCHYVLKNLTQPETEQVLDELHATLNQADSYGLVVELAELSGVSALSLTKLMKYIKTVKELKNTEELEPLIIKLQGKHLMPKLLRIFIKVFLQLCSLYKRTISTLIRSWIQLIDTDEMIQLLQNVTLLLEIELKGYSRLVHDVLKAALMLSDVDPAKDLTSLFVLLEEHHLRDFKISFDIILSLQQHTEKMKTLLPEVLPLPKKQLGTLSVQLLKAINTDTVDFLTFVVRCATELIHSVPPNAVSTLCEQLLSVKSDSEKAIVSKLQANFQSVKGDLVACLNEVGDQVTLKNVDFLFFVACCRAELVKSVQPEAVAAFSELLLRAQYSSGKNFVTKLKTNYQEIKGYLVSCLNRFGGQVTLEAVESMLPKSTELVNVQPTHMRFFDFQNEQWIPPVRLASSLNWTSYTGPSYVILDDGRVFCCGGSV